MKLNYIRLNLQEILIISEPRYKDTGRPLGAIHIGNKTIFLKRGGYYENIQTELRQQIQRDLNDIVKPNWRVLHSPDSFGLNEWDDETQSHLSLGELSYGHLSSAEKDARKVDTNTLPEVKPDNFKVTQTPIGLRIKT